MAAEDAAPEHRAPVGPHVDNPGPNRPQELGQPEPQQQQRVQVIDAALKRLHANLGHPSERELTRILKHSGASALALQRVSEIRCGVCLNQSRPSAPLPANTSVAQTFNEKVGLDVKYLPGWQARQKIPCVNIVDYATSLQVMVPLTKMETGDTIRAALRDRWVSWAGPPQVLNLDPSQPNLSEALGSYCNNVGIDMRHTAAEAHYQLGKVERHGQWLGRIMQRVLDEIRPDTEQEWLDCLSHAQSSKNTLLTEAGASPYQLVFGRNPRVPVDLLQDAPHMPAVDAEQHEPLMQRAACIRATARRAMLECQSDRAVRAALRARPRALRPFKSGDWVYYWRTQKSVDGVRIDGGRWYGAGLVLGSAGRNFIVAHRRSLLRCSPEQLRFASPAETVVAEFPESELLGIKTLLEKGQFPKNQFVDVTQEGRPPEAPAEPDVSPPSPEHEAAAGLNAAQCLERRRIAEHEPSPVPAPELPSAVESRPDREPYPPVSAAREPQPEEHEYAPVRRIPRKTPESRLARLPETRPEDFIEMMSEIAPKLIADFPEAVSHGEGSGSSSSNAAPKGDQVTPRGSSHKRSASSEPAEAPSGARARTEETEALFCQATLDDLSHLHSSHVGTLMAAFIQKRAQKEIPASGNNPELQEQVDEAKTIEWETIISKSAVRIHSGPKAEEIRAKFGHRFIGSRFVVTNKVEEDSSRIKARWCLQGHNDPDFRAKIESGECHSPTLHQLSRAWLLQVLASKGWELNLGDIKGAFLEAGPIPEKYRPLYASQPPGGIPGIDPSDVIEVVGNLYGANNAPAEWFKEFDSQTRAAGFQPSIFDPCLYYFRHRAQQLTGILGAHVDDTITGGEGEEYKRAIEKLKARFRYRKWRQGSGEFCGVQYFQDPVSKEITYEQKVYAQHIRPINLTKDRQKQKDLPATDREITALRAVNGALNWLSSSNSSRPKCAGVVLTAGLS